MSEIKFKNSLTIFMLAASTVVVSGATIDMFVPSLPHIQKAFNASIQQTQLIVPICILAYGIFQLVAGAISDSFGRRKTLLVSLIGFIIATIAAPFSTNIVLLLLLRFMQGTLTAGIAVCSRALISDTFSGTALAKYAAYLTFAWVLGPTASPYLGGYLQHFFGWKSTFYVLGGYACLITLLIYFLLPETAPTRHHFRLATIFTNYLTIYRNKIFITGALTCSCAYSLIIIYNVCGPFLIQHTLGYSAIVYGRIALCLGAACLSGNLLCRLMVTRQSPSRLIVSALALGIVIVLVMVYLAYSNYFNLWSTVAPPVLLFIIVGTVFAYCFGKCLGLFRSMGGTASAALGSLYSIIAAVVAGFSTLLKTNTLIPLALSYLVIIILMLMFFSLHEAWHRK